MPFLTDRSTIDEKSQALMISRALFSEVTVLIVIFVPVFVESG
jgi:hypothetical protein